MFEKKINSSVEKTFKKLFALTFLGDVYSEKSQNKIISFTKKSLIFVSNITTFIAFGYIMLILTYPKIGFEKTVVTLLVILVGLMRNFLKNLNLNDGDNK